MAATIEPGRYVTTFPRLKDRTALVTGGSSGIGRAISLAYANEGARVLTADLHPSSRNPDEADITTHDLIQKNGGEAGYVETDVTNETSIENAVKEAVARWGRLDMCVSSGHRMAKTRQLIMYQHCQLRWRHHRWKAPSTHLGMPVKYVAICPEDQL